jgi:hypothetical protein
VNVITLEAKFRHVYESTPRIDVQLQDSFNLSDRLMMLVGAMV